MQYNYIAVEGSIGAGKTTLAHMLAEAYNARLLLERFEENPFLERFYNDPSRYAFATEMSFMADRYQQLESFFKPDIFQPKIVADYAYFKSLIFAQQNLDNREFGLYRQFYQISFQQMPQPELIVHLNRPTEQLLKFIEKRGRSYEDGIEATYLDQLKQNYLRFYKAMPQTRVLLLEIGDVDFKADIIYLEQVKDLLDKPYPNGLTYVDLNKI